MLNSAYNFDVKGSATDIGLINFVMDITNPRDCYESQQNLHPSRRLLEVPFNSKIKKCLVAVRMPEKVGTDSEVRVFCKGASEIVLDLCSRYIDKNGVQESLDKVADGTNPMLFRLQRGGNE